MASALAACNAPAGAEGSLAAEGKSSATALFAKSLRFLVDGRMTPEQIAEAQSLVREWLETHYR